GAVAGAAPPDRDRPGRAGPADPDRVAPPVRPGGEPRQHGQHRDAARPGLGRRRRCRPVVRMGDDAPAPPEDRAGPRPPGPPRHGPRGRPRLGCRARGVSARPARPPPAPPPAPSPEARRLGPASSFRARLTAGLVAGSVLPLAGFGLVLLGTEIARTGGFDSTLIRVVVFVLAAAIIVAVLFAYFLAGNLTGPLRAVARAVERTSAGDL